MRLGRWPDDAGDERVRFEQIAHEMSHNPIRNKRAQDESPRRRHYGHADHFTLLQDTQ